MHTYPTSFLSIIAPHTSLGIADRKTHGFLHLLHPSILARVYQEKHAEVSHMLYSTGPIQRSTSGTNNKQKGNPKSMQFGTARATGLGGSLLVHVIAVR